MGNRTGSPDGPAIADRVERVRRILVERGTQHPEPYGRNRDGYSRDERRLGDVRAVFVSDLHLGCKHARADLFLSFLNGVRPEFLYLVGDVIDGWRLRRVWRWSPTYDAILGRLVALSQEGTLVRYTPGNHDRFLRAFLTRVGRIELADEFVHVTADGRRFLVTHGDKFDRFETEASWACVLATFAYDAILNTNRLLNRLTGQTDYALATAVKLKVKALVRFVSDFERSLAVHARRKRCDGVVCGHVHHPASRQLGKVAYLNTGDWIEHSTALIERRCGTLELVAIGPDGPTTLAVVPPDATGRSFGTDPFDDPDERSPARG